MNKKKIFGSIAVLAIAAVVALNLNIMRPNDAGIDITLINAEALASESEASWGGGCMKEDGWHTPTSNLPQCDNGKCVKKDGLKGELDTNYCP